MKYNTKITEANDGNHSPRHTRTAWMWLDKCSATYKEARLYHLCLCGAEYSGHKLLLKALMKRLSRKGIKATYRACREIDSNKGDHLHAYICCEASAINPCSVLNRSKACWLSTYCKKRGITVYLNPPADVMHGGNNYASLPKTKPEKIADAKIWITYLYKVRSKPEGGEIYSASK